MFDDTKDGFLGRGEIQILLDGAPVILPPGDRSLSGVRSYLEALSLERQRVLSCFIVDGIPVPPGATPPNHPYSRVEGETFDLDAMPLEMVRSARDQARLALREVQSGVTLVLINDSTFAREWFWGLTKLLKEPLVTLNLLPEKLWGRTYSQVSAAQLRKWQLQQLGAIIRELDQAAAAEDSSVLSEALEARALPWLESLLNSLDLWHETLQSELGLTACS